MKRKNIYFRGYTLISKACKGFTLISKACKGSRNAFKGGFTLIELLVVIAIVGILMSIAIVAFQGVRKSARDGRRKVDLEQIRSALELCHSDTGSYPLPVSNAVPNPLTCSGATYLQAVPSDPLGATYDTYFYWSNGAQYAICTKLETGGETTGCGTCTAPRNYKVCNP